MSSWYYSALDIIGAIIEEDDYKKNRNYWKYLKKKLVSSSQLVSGTTQLKLESKDGKKYRSDVLSDDEVIIVLTK